MLYRHDRLKIGYERERKAKLTDYQMQRMFEAFSFVSLKNNKTRFPSPKFREYLELSSKLERLGENIEDALIQDITGITALVIKDGYDEYSYSHKSVQEYFAAVFVARLNDERKTKFYQSVVSDYDEFRKWHNTLSFLSVIDERNYRYHFLIPFKRRSLNLDSSGMVNFTYKALMQMIGSDTKIEVTENGDILSVYWGDTYSSSLFKEYSYYSRQVMRSYLDSKRNEIASFIAFCEVEDYEKYKAQSGEFIVSMNSLLVEGNLESDACMRVSKEFQASNFKEEIEKMELEVKSSEKVTDDILQF